MNPRHAQDDLSTRLRKEKPAELPSAGSECRSCERSFHTKEIA